MDLLKAIERCNKLDSDVRKLDEWVSHLHFEGKPVVGEEWVKLKRSIVKVIDEIALERNELEDAIKQVTAGLEIDLPKTKTNNEEV